MGKNSVKTLKNCINHIREAVKITAFINNYEIIYVDSNSSDNSVKIAKENNVEVIEIIDGYTTASLGRYLGKKYAKYNNLLFIDSDMYLDAEWFKASKKYYEKYGAIIGERYEKLYRDDKVIKEIPKFYDIKNIEVASNIGGFLMIKKEIIRNVNYTPIIKNEEEKDFYAKFYDKSKIYKIPIIAYIHNNYNLTSSRLKDYIYPYNKNGYIISLLNSLKNGYFMNYLFLQKRYVLSICVSIIFYISFFIESYTIGVSSLFFLLFNGKKQIKGSVMTTIFFPYKFIMSLIFLLKNKSCQYVYRNISHKIEIKI
ncbi:glycosyltransferase family 2 protein [Aliarcobacter butzleri]